LAGNAPSVGQQPKVEIAPFALCRTEIECASNGESRMPYEVSDKLDLMVPQLVSR
jgi:hypothetical protein